jgi:hypothetical protein
MAQEQLTARDLINEIDDLLNSSSDDMGQNGDNIPDYGSMSAEQLVQAFNLEELSAHLPKPNPESHVPADPNPMQYNLEPISPEPYVPEIHIPEPQVPEQRPMSSTPKRFQPSPLTGANKVPIKLKIKVPRPPTRPAAHKPALNIYNSEPKITQLEIRMFAQQPQGSRPDNMFIGILHHPYMTTAIKASHLYNSILKDAKDYLTSMNPFNVIKHHMKLDLRQPKFSYIGQNGFPISVSGALIPRPYSEALPEPIGIGAPTAIITLNFVIEATPMLPKRKTIKKRLFPDSERDENPASKKRSALPPNRNKKYLYEI